MTILAGMILGMVCVAGVVLAVVGLPGTWLMVLAALLIELWRPELLSWTAIITAGALAFIAEAAELIAGAIGAKRAGGSRRAAIGAVAGGVMGAVAGTFLILIPVVGTVLGAAIGSGIGAAAMEVGAVKRTPGHIRRVGVGAFIGRLVATVLKTMFAVMIAAVLIASACVGGW